MDILATPGIYERQRELGFRLANGLSAIANEVGIPVIVEGIGTAFQMWFSDKPIHNWREADKFANEEIFTRWYREMLQRGVLFHPNHLENLFVSLVHTDADIDKTLEAAQGALSAIAKNL